jgi:hypothetical protein
MRLGGPQSWFGYCGREKQFTPLESQHEILLSKKETPIPVSFRSESAILMLHRGTRFDTALLEYPS